MSSSRYGPPILQRPCNWLFESQHIYFYSIVWLDSSHQREDMAFKWLPSEITGPLLQGAFIQFKTCSSLNPAIIFLPERNGTLDPDCPEVILHTCAAREDLKDNLLENSDLIFFWWFGSSFIKKKYAKLEIQWWPYSSQSRTSSLLLEQHPTCRTFNSY